MTVEQLLTEAEKDSSKLRNVLKLIGTKYEDGKEEDLNDIKVRTFSYPNLKKKCINSQFDQKYTFFRTKQKGFSNWL